MGKSFNHTNLNQLSKRFPFHAPESYFDDFPMKVMDRIGDESRTPEKQFFIRLLKPTIGLAASFLFIIGLIYIPAKLIFYDKVIPNQSTIRMADEESLISYQFSDHNIFENLENTVSDDTFDNDQLETVLLASVNDYELIDLTN